MIEMNDMERAVRSNTQNTMSRIWQETADKFAEEQWANSLGFRSAQAYHEATDEAFSEEQYHQDEFEGQA